MIDTGITIKLYSFSELNEKAKRKAIEAHREFELSIMQPLENSRALQDFPKLQGFTELSRIAG